MKKSINDHLLLNLDQQLTSQYKKSILHRYLADSVENLPKVSWNESQTAVPADQKVPREVRVKKRQIKGNSEDDSSTNLK